ncbi:MAG: hypothetical protein ACYCSN_02865 [Acidobacteriaceae bacterium]
MGKHEKISRGLRAAAAAICAAAALLAATACNSKTVASNENFMQALNAHFIAHPDCLFVDAPRFPYETYDAGMTRQMDALVSVDLLTVQREPSIHASRYTTTAAGLRAGPRFCYGHRVITSIDSFSPPTLSNGFIETRASYHYRMKDIPVWVDTAQMRAAFPAMATAISGNATDTATLAKTMTGWQVPE